MNTGDPRFVGYRPRYYLRERMHNAFGYAMGIPTPIRDLVHVEYVKLLTRLPSTREEVRDPLIGRFIFIEILRILAGRKDLDAPTTRFLRSPTPKERWTLFWKNETNGVIPDEDDSEFAEKIRTGHASMMLAFRALKSDVWAMRKNLPYLPYVMGVYILRVWGLKTLLPIVAWWPPPKTAPTLKKCRDFIRLATERGFLPAAHVPEEEDYPIEVFQRLEKGKKLAKRVHAVLSSPPSPF